MPNWHALSAADCLHLLRSSPQGLSSAEASQRLHDVGPNQLVAAPRKSPWAIFLEQFKDFMIVVLLVATLISGLMGEFADAITIIAIVLVNAILGFVQEYRAEQAINALKELTSPQIDVLRDGQLLTLDVRQLVPGDIVQVLAGVRIPADLRILQALALEADEAALTGESLPVRKGTDPVSDQAQLGDRSSMLYAGTLVTRGHGQGLVVATGMETEMGRIAEMLQDVEREPTPLQQRLDQLGKFIVWACLAICAAVVILGVARGEEITAMFLAGVSLAVAAIPEGLPAIVTIALAIGVQRMIRANAIVRKLPAVETLGCSTVICSDKTGTLTKNEMTVRRLWLADGYSEVSGDGYAPDGEIRRQQRPPLAAHDSALAMLLTVGALCNNSTVQQLTPQAGRIRRGPVRYIAKGDPTEAALLTVAAKGGISRDELLREYQVLDAIPFDSERKRMSVIVEDQYGQRWCFIKGAPDVLLDRSTSLQHGQTTRRLTPEMRQAVLAEVEAMGGQALRVLAAGYRRLDAASSNKVDDVESSLTLIGLFGMIDPPRPEVQQALRTCETAGIRTIMITGDHAATARAIGSELGLLGNADRVLTGAELSSLTEREWQEAVRNTRIFARVSPNHKLEIVRRLKQQGHVVAMTGDGVNDAPALLESDIGVAMGSTGTDVAKEAAALVLSDDNFATIVGAIREGRAIYDNIRKFIRYLLSCNVGELLTVFLSMVLRLPLPLKPLQILWVNLVTDGLPAMALGVEAGDRDLMQRQPRPREEGVFARGLGRKIITRGVLIGLTTTAIFGVTLHMTGHLKLARTMAFATLVFCQLFHVFDCRSETMGLLEKGVFSNPLLIGAVAISTLMFLAVLYVAPLRQLFDTVPLGSEQWLVVLIVSGLPTVAIAVRRALRRRRRRR